MMVFMVMVIVMVFMIMLMVFMMMFFLQLRLLVELPFSAINQCNSTQLSGEHVASLHPPTPHHHLHHFEKKCIIGFFFSTTILSLAKDHFSKYRWFFIQLFCRDIAK